jgi:hypothetical protein
MPRSPGPDIDNTDAPISRSLSEPVHPQPLSHQETKRLCGLWELQELHQRELAHEQYPAGSLFTPPSTPAPEGFQTLTNWLDLYVQGIRHSDAKLQSKCLDDVRQHYTSTAGGAGAFRIESLYKELDKLEEEKNCTVDCGWPMKELLLETAARRLLLLPPLQDTAGEDFVPQMLSLQLRSLVDAGHVESLESGSRRDWPHAEAVSNPPADSYLELTNQPLSQAATPAEAPHCSGSTRERGSASPGGIGSENRASSASSRRAIAKPSLSPSFRRILRANPAIALDFIEVLVAVARREASWVGGDAKQGLLLDGAARSVVNEPGEMF